MSRDTHTAGLSLLLSITLVVIVSASARLMYDDGKASAAQVTDATAEQLVACQ